MGSEGETKDDCTPATDPMEISSGSVLGKRGPETLSTEDPDEVDDDEVDEEDDVDSMWDKDSFDGREYNPDDDSEYSDEEFQKIARAHNREVIESKGFFDPSNSPLPPFYIWGGISTISDDLDKQFHNGGTAREFLGNIVTECVDKFNQRNKPKKLIFVEYLRGNWIPGGSTKLYLTFNAKESDSPDAPILEYQAKAIWSAGKTIPILCRPAPLKKGVEDIN